MTRLTQAQYANLRDGKMYLGDKPKYGIKTAALCFCIALGLVALIDPADAFSGVHKDCLVTEGRC